MKRRSPQDEVADNAPLQALAEALAPVLNGPTIADGVTVETMHEAAPVAVMMKRRGGRTYVFAVMMCDRSSRARVAVSDLTGVRRVEVLDEDRALECRDGSFVDEFAPWDVHLYRIERVKTP